MKRSAKDFAVSAYKGFTLMELIVVIAVLVILAAVTVPFVLNFITSSKTGADIANLRLLNDATQMYKSTKPGYTAGDDLFTGIADDTQRMGLLVSQGVLNEEITTQSEGAEFLWNIDSQRWLYSAYEVAVDRSSAYPFQNLSLSDFRTRYGTWTINDKGFYSKADLLFIDNNRSEYTLINTAVLDAGSTNGGYGILFETTLTADNKDTGYILQFDRGVGEIIIRPRTGGNEGNPIVRIGNNSSSTVKTQLIPSNRSDPWWSQSHQIALTIAKVAGQEGEKSITVTLDNQVILRDLVITSTIDPTNNFTGLRTWSSIGATFENLIIQ